MRARGVEGSDGGLAVPATRPALPGIARGLAIRVLLPAVALTAAGLGTGWLLVIPFASSTGEDEVNVVLEAGRTPLLDTIALTASAIGSVAGNAVICVLSVALVWLLSRRWWFAALPALALQLHVIVHIVTSTLVARPRPPVPALDIGQPTASFPSGHVGATTAQLLVVVLFLCHTLASRVARVAIVVVTTTYLLVLAWSRLYLGMHHVTDVVWGGVNGVACGMIAWLFIRHEAPDRAALTKG